MKKPLLAALALVWIASAQGQESETTYNFLRLPVSAHVAALGGDGIALPDDDASLIFHNPSLISNVSDKTLGLNFMTYMEGSKTASASFILAHKERGTWGFAAQYMDYGDIRQFSADNVELGDVSAKDVMLMGTYTYLLSDKIAGGVTAKFISSSLAGYSSTALAVDLGLNYYDPSTGISLSAVARNLGGQVEAYEDDFEKLPFDLQIGASKRLGHSPLRFSATFSRLHKWDERFANHLTFGIDILLSKNIYVAGGYNFRRAHEMKVEDEEDQSSHGAALSFGAGLHIKKFKLDVAYAKYHVSTSSLTFNVSYAL